MLGRQNNLSIYTVERAVTESEFEKPVAECCHSSLALVREEAGELLVAEEINFKNEGQLTLYFSKFNPNTRTRFKRAHLFGYIGGSEEHIRPIWDKMVGLAYQIDKLGVPYDRRRLADSYNCRAVAMTLLEHVGLEFYLPDRVQTESGMHSSLTQHVKQHLS